MDDRHRANLEPALQTYSSLPAHYSPYKWTSLETYMLTQAIDLHAQAGGSKDENWINLVLSFLKAYTIGNGHDLLMPESESREYVARIIETLKSVADGLESGKVLFAL